MWYRQLLVLPLIAGLVWVLAGAWAQQATPPAKSATPSPAASTPTPPPAPKADPEAGKLLSAALEQFGPQNQGWLKTQVWQQVNLQGLTFHSDGSYLVGPGHRLRLDLKVHVGGCEGQMQVTCDGTTLWQMFRAGNEKPIVNKFALTEILSFFNGQGVVPQVRNEFLQSQSFLGVTPILQSLQQMMVLTKHEPGEWKGNKANVLTGSWNADIAKNLGTADKWIQGMPRKCVVYLDAQTNWPLRIEWWGPSTQAGDQLLMEMEFRDPQMLKATDKDPAEFVALCKFDESKFEATNQTKQIAEFWKERNRQLAAKAAQPTPPKK
jgi:hypothetical protein